MTCNCLVVLNMRLTANSKYFSRLKAKYQPLPYTKKRAREWFNSVDVQRILAPEYQAAAEALFRTLFQKLGFFPDGASLRYEIVRGYNAMFHMDTGYSKCLFFNIVLHTADTPHIFTYALNKAKSDNITMLSGIGFVFDPMIWHSVTNVNPDVQEFVVLQCVAEYQAENRANELRKLFTSK